MWSFKNLIQKESGKKYAEMKPKMKQMMRAPTASSVESWSAANPGVALHIGGRRPKEDMILK